MAKALKLNDGILRHAKPKDKPYKLADGKGLYILIHPRGSKYWRYKYYLDGKEKLMALGVYPEISLEEARRAIKVARQCKRDGLNPIQQMRYRKIKNKADREYQELMMILETEYAKIERIKAEYIKKKMSFQSILFYLLLNN